MLKIWKELPKDIIEHILSFAPNFRDNLMNCQLEILNKHRPCYFKKEIADSPTWHDFKINDMLTVIKARGSRYEPMEYMNFQLHAIEITPKRRPNHHYYHDRDMILYYGWSKSTDREFWNTVLTWNKNAFEFAPGYY